MYTHIPTFNTQQCSRARLGLPTHRNIYAYFVFQTAYTYTHEYGIPIPCIYATVYDLQNDTFISKGKRKRNFQQESKKKHTHHSLLILQGWMEQDQRLLSLLMQLSPASSWNQLCHRKPILDFNIILLSLKI